jgi:type II secretory pathway pseudopilin PulG
MEQLVSRMMDRGMWRVGRPGSGGFSLVELGVALLLIVILVGVVILAVTGFFSGARETGMDTDIRVVKTAVDSYITGCSCMPTESGVLPPAGEYAPIDFNANCGLCPQNETFYPHFLAKLPKHWDEGVWLLDSAAKVTVDMAPEEY